MKMKLHSCAGPFAREALVCRSFPLATPLVLFASKDRAMEADSASALLLSTMLLIVTVPSPIKRSILTA
jgi:malonate transporter